MAAVHWVKKSGGGSGGNLEVQDEGVVVGTHPKLNFKSGGGILIEGNDDTANNRNEITLTVGDPVEVTTVPAGGLYREIRIRHEKVGGSDATDYTLVFSGTYDWLRSISNGGKVATPDPGSGLWEPLDVYFTADDGTTVLDFEPVKNGGSGEEWNPATGKCEFWVRVPTVSHTVDTIIRIYYGDVAENTDQSNRHGVWVSKYKLAAHMTGSGTPYFDSTSNNHDAGPRTSDPGKLGTCTTQNTATVAALALASNYSNLEPANEFTIAVWWKPDTSGHGAYGFVTSYGSWPNYAVVIRENNTDPTSIELNVHKTNGTDVLASSPTGSITLGAWHYIVGTYDNATGVAKLYIDGALAATSSSGNTVAIDYDSGGYRLSLGQPWDQAFYAKAPGGYDELQFLNEKVDDDWVTRNYNNQLNPDDFYIISGENGESTGIVGTLASDSIAIQFESIASGQVRHYQIPYACSIVGWSAFGDVAGTVSVDVCAAHSAEPSAVPNLPDTTLDKISASAPIAFTSAQTAAGGSGAVSSWDRDRNKWDVLAFHVTTATTVGRVLVQLHIKRRT